MIETSTVFILFAASIWWIVKEGRDARLAHLTWVADATFLYRNALEWVGRDREAEEATEVAGAINRGLGIIFHKLPRTGESAKEIHQAALKASGDEWLGHLGVNNYSVNHRAAKNALFWFAKKFSAVQ